MRVQPWRKRERDCTFTIPDIPPWHGWKRRSGGFSRGKRIKGLISRLGGSSRSRSWAEPHRTRPRATLAPCPLCVASIYRHRDRVEIKGYSAMPWYTILYIPHRYIYIYIYTGWKRDKTNHIALYTQKFIAADYLAGIQIQTHFF